MRYRSDFVDQNSVIMKQNAFEDIDNESKGQRRQIEASNRRNLSLIQNKHKIEERKKEKRETNGMKNAKQNIVIIISFVFAKRLY